MDGEQETLTLNKKLEDRFTIIVNQKRQFNSCGSGTGISA